MEHALKYKTVCKLTANFWFWTTMAARVALLRGNTSRQSIQTLKLTPIWIFWIGNVQQVFSSTHQNRLLEAFIQLLLFHLIRIGDTGKKIRLLHTWNTSYTFVMFLISVIYICSRGLPRNPNASGPLTDKPDFSFIDGRPTPLGKGQKRRMILNHLRAVIYFYHICLSNLIHGSYSSILLPAGENSSNC